MKTDPPPMPPPLEPRGDASFYPSREEAELIDDALAFFAARIAAELGSLDVSRAPAHVVAGRNIAVRVARIRARLAPFLPSQAE